MIKTIKTGATIVAILGVSLMLQGCLVGAVVGTAGAIVGGAEDTAAAKIAVFKDCGIEVAATPSDMADALLRSAQAKGVVLK